MMLLIGGVLAVLEGVVGISRDAIFVATRGDYPYKFDVRAWGGIHLVLGVIAVLVGYGLLRGAARARYAGIAIDTSAIWALATFRPVDARRGSMR
jgi:hypothetical protein